MDDCFDEQALLDFLAGRLDGRRTAHAREHIARCEVCNAIATDRFGDAVTHLQPPSSRTKSYELKPNAIVAERYRLLGALGEGGMGVVWEAEPLEPRDGLSSRVAIKLLKAFDAAAKQRFLREIAISSKLNHRGLVRVVDVLEDVEAGCPALVMERLYGASLASKLLEDNKLEARRARAIALELARTLAVVHEAGLVHRDIKPANVHLLPDAGRPVVLLDLGLAKAVAGGEMTRLTRTGQAVGTPAYMAPERLSGETSIDGRADLWSLGVVLYECVVGQRPFHGHTAAEILRAALEGVSSPDGVDPDTARILRALLRPQRTDRPRNACAVIDMLAAVDPRG